MSDVVIRPLFDEDGQAEVDAPSCERVDRHTPRLHIEFIPVADTIEFNYVRFNLNNKYDYGVDPSNPKRLVKLDAPARPHDYEAAAEHVATRCWIDEFHSHYCVVNIDKRHLAWMKESSHLAVIKPGLSPLYKDDVDEVVRTTNTGTIFAACNRADPSTGYFCRTDRFSLKQGMHGAGPFFGLREIIESTITASGGHQAVDSGTTALKLYLLPWLTDLDENREFRVFVCNGRVTAVSQQHLYTANKILHLATSDEDRRRIIANWCELLLQYIDRVVIPRVAIASFVLDICLLGPRPSLPDGGIVDRDEPSQLRPYFIEVNQFGYAYGAGSSLFSWVEHYAVLYGLEDDLGDVVHVRVTL